MELLANNNFIELSALLKKRHNLCYADNKGSPALIVRIYPSNLLDYPCSKNQILFPIEWNQSLKSFSLTPNQNEYLRIQTSYVHKSMDLRQPYMHITGNKLAPVKYSLTDLSSVYLGFKDSPAYAVTSTKNQAFEDRARQFSENALFHRDHYPDGTNKEVSFSHQISAYDAVCVASFLLDVTKNLFESGKAVIEDQSDPEINQKCVEQLETLIQYEVKIANTLYDFSEELAQAIGMDTSDKISRNTGLKFNR